MTVVVNDTKVRIFKNARVGDVLLRYAVRKGLDLSIVPQLRVTDRWGHTIDHTAPLHDKQEIKTITP